MRVHINEIQSALADQRRLREAAVGTFEDVAGCTSCIKWGFSAGDSAPGDDWFADMEGQRVAIVPLDQEGE